MIVFQIFKLVAVEFEGNGSIWVVWYGTVAFVSGLFIHSFGTNTGGRTSSSGGGCSCRGTATVVRAFLVFCEGACSDNMGNKESNVGIFSFSDGINLSMFPIVEVVKEVFLLYHMKRIPMTMVQIPVSINRANINFGDIENG